MFRLQVTIIRQTFQYIDMTLYVDKIQQDATVCRYLFTANILYAFRMFIAPIIRST